MLSQNKNKKWLKKKKKKVAPVPVACSEWADVDPLSGSDAVYNTYW